MNTVPSVDVRSSMPLLSPEISEPIAIVGVGCRFPGGASNVESYWRLLSSGRDAIREVPKDRWNIDKYYSPDIGKPGKMYIRKGGFLEERIDKFDAAFFNISPREAAYMDPQQRFLLEVAWESLEDAGAPPSELVGSNVGVYVGGFTLDNLLLQMSPLNREIIGTHTATSVSMTMLANRLSYCFDFRGPSVSVDTACSSSLVAVHLACSAIRRGECSMALAGGVNIMLRPEYPIVMCKGHFLSPDGYSKSFDARANGYARGEGAGIVVLKPLSAAQRDGDRIYAVVRGSGVNQDGRTDGVTVPSADAQEVLIRRIYAESGVSFTDVRYVEAHGTGTPVGDPIEASVIGRTIGEGRKGKDSCIIGSAKATIGHLEAAAGVAGLIKASLCLHHKAVPPQANLLEQNPNIPFDELGLRLPRILEPMPKGDGPACVGVNSFGYGGTNAHVILQEAPLPETPKVSTTNDGAQILTLSARDPQALNDLAHAYARQLSAPDAAFADICYSANVRRAHHEHRLAVAANSAEQAAAELDAFVEHGRSPQSCSGRAMDRSRRNAVFVFTGMGPQWPEMGRELFASEPVFRQAVLLADECFHSIAGWSILKEMHADRAVSRMAETQIAQPANFVLQFALAELLRSWEIHPAAIVGHSVGEVGAACVSGALSLEDAVRVSYYRSQLQQRVAGQGKMLATGLTFPQAETLLARWSGKVSIGAVNGVSDVTLSGDPDALAVIAKELGERQIFNRLLKVEVAYHSPQMDALKDDMRAALKDIRPTPPALPTYSTVTGRLIDGTAFDAEYWCDNIREPVRFADAVGVILADGHRAFLEVGPHPVLASSLRDALRRHEKQAAPSGNSPGAVLATLRRQEPERLTLIEGIGGLYVNGYNVGWKEITGEGRRYVKLPSYAWQRETFWNETPKGASDRIGQPEHPLLGVREPSPAPAWGGELNFQVNSYLSDHVVDSVTLFPGAGYIEQAVAIHRLVDDAETGVLENIEFRRPLVVTADKDPSAHATFDETSREFRIYTQQDDSAASLPAWTLHASGRISASPPVAPSAASLDEIRQRCPNLVDGQSFYARLVGNGLQYGPRFQKIARYWSRPGEVLAELTAPGEQDGPIADYHLHPAVLDAGIQALIAGFGDDAGGYLPVGVGRVSYWGRLEGRCWSHCEITKETKDSGAGNVRIYDDQGNIIVEILNLQCRALDSLKGEARNRFKNLSYVMAWEEASLEDATTDKGRWLIISGEADLGAAMADGLREGGADEVMVVRLQDVCGSGRDAPQVFEQILAAQGELQGVVFAPGLNGKTVSETPARDDAHVQLLYLAQAMSQPPASQTQTSGGRAQRRLYVVTRGAQRAEDDTAPEMSQSLAVGLARTALSEFPHTRCTVVDLDPSDGPESIRHLAAELLSNSDETSVALRGSRRLVQRLTPLSRLEKGDEPEEEVTLTAAEAGAFQLEVGVAGRIENLRFRQMSRRALTSGEVEISVRATALNFKDVSKVLGMLPARALESTYYGADLGMEAAGVVTAVGEGVTDFRVGDAVVASLRNSFSSHVVVKADQLLGLPKPDALSFMEAASLPVVFMTAYYALHELARLQKGETVLIHAAAGGVGLAAIQVARYCGATIIATAGGEEKRAYLHSLGVEHVLNSRTLEFADQVMTITGDRGVDVVLNSLSGEPFLKSLQITAPLGRFIEIGKRDIVENVPMPMLPFNRNLSFHAVDLDRIMLDKPDLARRLLREVSDRFQAGDFKPVPVVSFPAAGIVDAFRHMAQSKHIGKIVVSFEESDDVAVLPRQEKRTLFKPDASYLITGGLGGFGLEIARWMVREGVRHLVLTGRSGVKGKSAEDAIREMQGQGASIRVIPADVGDEGGVSKLLDEIGRSGPPLRGVLHAAAVLDDTLLINLDETRLQRVIAPKAHGAWLLHKLTLDLPLDCFVLFSSVSALLGNPGQGNYVAANTFLDSLAHYRRARGLPATSVNWGAIAGAGMAASGGAAAEHLSRIGVNGIPPMEAAEALGQALESGATQLAFMDVNWEKWRQVHPVTANLPTFASVSGATERGEGSPARMLRNELLAMAPEQRPMIIAREVAAVIAQTMRLPLERLDLNERLSEMGIDSLLAVELQIGINSKLEIEIPVLELVKGGSVLGLAQDLLARMNMAEKGEVN